jgi:hypothetical protein
MELAEGLQELYFEYLGDILSQCVSLGLVQQVFCLPVPHHHPVE